jgi:hypothetical protein
MGRRSHGHSYVKWIILIDPSGSGGQRHELDQHGRLLHQDPQPLTTSPKSLVLSHSSHDITKQLEFMSSPVQTELVHRPPVDPTLPIPPMLRQKLMRPGVFVTAQVWDDYLRGFECSQMADRDHLGMSRGPIRA